MALLGQFYTFRYMIPNKNRSKAVRLLLEKKEKKREKKKSDLRTPPQFTCRVECLKQEEN